MNTNFRPIYYDENVTKLHSHLKQNMIQSNFAENTGSNRKVFTIG